MTKPKREFDFHAFVAAAALESGRPFPLRCNCGGVCTVMPPFQDEYVVCPKCESRIRMLVLEGDPGYVMGVDADGNPTQFPIQRGSILNAGNMTSNVTKTPLFEKEPDSFAPSRQLALAKEQINLVTKSGEAVNADELMEKLRSEARRVLADDEIGLVLYIGDLEIYCLMPSPDGRFIAQLVTEISRPSFRSKTLRRQIGAAIVSITTDSVFIIKDGDTLRKVRGEDLEPGMILNNGDKVLS